MRGRILLRKKIVVCGWVAAVVLSQPSMAGTAALDADGFATKVYEVTKGGDYNAYVQLIDPRCHPRLFTPKSFELRSELLNGMNPSAKVNAMPFASYQAMMKEKGAPPDRLIYSLEPSHIVIVHGTVPGVTGGNRVELGPILHSDKGWELLEGDCLSNGPADSSQTPK